ncbi:MAG: arylesterase [Desulfobacterales bacterium]|nr:arylesterase [Desulfobacterales bacterium]
MRKTVLVIAAVVLVGIGIRWSRPAAPITNAEPAGENIICFGDSLTYGTGAPDGMDYPSQLSALIEKPVINTGVPGDTTAQALNRLEADVLSHSPRLVLLTLGGNDLKNRVPRKAAFDNLRRIVVEIQKAGALVVIGGIDIPLYGRGFDEAYRQLAQETGSVLIPNVFEGIMGNRNLMSDPIHPNADGYAVMARTFHRAIAPYL